VIVVLDTNVVFAALVANGLCREVFRRTVVLGGLTSSDALVAELEGVISRNLQPTPEVTLFLKEFRRHVRLVEPSPLPSPICRDPDDDVVLATAIAGTADAIVTGDQDLLVLVDHQGIRILSPRQFLQLADAAAEAP
jgi:putative PIN family toxin of toxin-antitoxin system